MTQGYDVHVIPKEATYRPTPARITELVKFLSLRLEIAGDFSVDGEDELSTENAIEHLRAAAQSNSGGSECTVSFNDLVSGSLFGYDQDASDPDENFWADEVRIYLTAIPFPWCDWEYEDATCPACGQRFSQIKDLLEEVRLTGSPVTCPCGARTLPEDLKKSPGVNLAQLAIVFGGNKGWHYEVSQDRDLFKDSDFLASLEQILATPLEVVVIGC